MDLNENSFRHGSRDAVLKGCLSLVVVLIIGICQLFFLELEQRKGFAHGLFYAVITIAFYNGIKLFRLRNINQKGRINPKLSLRESFRRDWRRGSLPARMGSKKERTVVAAIAFTPILLVGVAIDLYMILCRVPWTDNIYLQCAFYISVFLLVLVMILHHQYHHRKIMKRYNRRKNSIVNVSVDGKQNA